MCFIYFQDPAGIFDLIEVVGNGTYGQVYKVFAYVSILNPLLLMLYGHLGIAYPKL